MTRLRDYSGNVVTLEAARGWAGSFLAEFPGMTSALVIHAFSRPEDCSGGYTPYLIRAAFRELLRGELEHTPAPSGPSSTTEVVSGHAQGFTRGFRRQWGPEATADMAVGLTRQQQRPAPEWPPTDQLWAYHAMAALRQTGRAS